MNDREGSNEPPCWEQERDDYVDRQEERRFDEAAFYHNLPQLCRRNTISAHYDHEPIGLKTWT